MTRPGKNKDAAVSDLQAICRQIAEDASLPMAAVTGPEHVICYVNPAFCALTGKSAEELTGVPFDRAVPEGKACLPHLERLYRTVEPQGHTDKELPQGQPHWMYSMWAVPHAFTRPTGILIQVTDVTGAAQLSQRIVDVNRELMITAVRQHERLEAAEQLSAGQRKEISERIQAENELLANRELLEKMVEERTSELVRANESLQKEIAGRMGVEASLKTSLEEVEMLLRELSHRTKNNMQVIGNLLRLQASKSGDQRISEILGDSQDRIRAMALVHEKLYKSGTYSRLSMKAYLEELVTSILKAHQEARVLVAPVLELEEIFFSLDDALPCGLIINELVSNSLKHAFADRKTGNIFLSLRCGEDAVEIRYRDDGPGLPRDLDLSQVETLGLILVRNLATRQLRGTIELRHDTATEFVIRFPRPKYMKARSGKRGL